MKRRNLPATPKNNISIRPKSVRHLRRILYVLELSPLVFENRDFVMANTRCGENAECLYVGSTSQTVGDRLRDHRQGHNASKIAGKHVLKIRYDLMPPQIPMNRKRALDRERELARSLRSKGYAVWQR